MMLRLLQLNILICCFFLLVLNAQNLEKIKRESTLIELNQLTSLYLRGKNFNTSKKIITKKIIQLNLIKKKLTEKEYQQAYSILKEALRNTYTKEISNRYKEVNKETSEQFLQLISNAFKDKVISKTLFARYRKGIKSKLKYDLNFSSNYQKYKSSQETIKFYINEAKKAYLSKDYIKVKKNLDHILAFQPQNNIAIQLRKKLRNIQKNIIDKRRANSRGYLENENQWSAILDTKKSNSHPISINEILENEKQKLLRYTSFNSSISFTSLTINKVVDKLNLILKENKSSFSIIIKLDKTISKKITELFPESSTLKNILEKITTFYGLTYGIKGNIIYISKTTKSFFKNFEITQFPVSDQIFNIIGESQKEVKKYLQNNGILFPIGSTIVVDTKFKKIFIKNNPTEIRKINSLLLENKSQYDSATVEAKIIEIEENSANEFNITLQKASSAERDFFTFPEDSSVTSFQPNNFLRNSFSDAFENTRNDIVNELAIENTDLLTYSYNIGNIPLESTLRTLQKSSYSSLLASPKATVKNGETAIIAVTQERYFPVRLNPPVSSTALQNNNGYRISIPALPIFRDPTELGIKFSAQPVINPDNYTIKLAVNPSIKDFAGFFDLTQEAILSDDAPIFIALGETDPSLPVVNITSRPSINLPIITIKSVSTVVNIWDGQAVSIGGIGRNRVLEVEDKVPILSSIPIIGRLFKRNYRINEKTQLNFIIKVVLNRQLDNNDGLPKF